jgi:hypothetical protein
MQGRFCERKGLPKNRFERASFRYKKVGRNWLLVGCPKGKWDARRRRCRTGTRMYKALVRAPQHGKCCPRGGRCLVK